MPNNVAPTPGRKVTADSRTSRLIFNLRVCFRHTSNGLFPAGLRGPEGHAPRAEDRQSRQ